MEALIDVALQDGVLTDQEKMVLIKRAQKEGIDIDELDIYIQSILQKRAQEKNAQELEEARNSKMGDVKKCPNCGGVLNPGNATCPHCGISLNAETKSDVVENLLKKLADVDGSVDYTQMKHMQRETLKVENAKKKMSIISSTVVPNTRGDILKLLAFTKAKAKKSGSNTGISDWDRSEDLSYAYWMLYESCISLAQVSFSNDPAFKTYFDYYESIQNKKVNLSKSQIYLYIAGAVILLLWLLMAIS